MSNWTIFSNHGHVLVCLARNSDARLRDIATDVGITERAVQKIVRDLQQGGMVSISKHGRRNQYRINRNKSLRHALEMHCSIGEFVKFVNSDMPAESEAPAITHAFVLSDEPVEPVLNELAPISLGETKMSEETAVVEPAEQEGSMDEQAVRFTAVDTDAVRSHTLEPEKSELQATEAGPAEIDSAEVEPAEAAPTQAEPEQAEPEQSEAETEMTATAKSSIETPEEKGVDKKQQGSLF